VKDVFDATQGVVLEDQVLFEADKMLNSIFPHLVPLLLTLGIYYLYSKKKWSPLKLMGLILVAAGVLTFIGYSTGFYA
jgi:PTS system mannose-specific IID component